jgi:type II secretory pathway pseudopilin PulG
MKQIFFSLKGNSAGFTLLELLLAMAVMIVVIGATVPLYGNLQWTAQLSESSAQSIGEARRARELSMARYNDSQYGVYFQVNPGGADRVISFRGGSYATRDAVYDRITTLSDTITLQTSLSGGSSEIVFSKNFGRPSSTGTITMAHVGSGRVAVISINSYGMVDSQ